ncbi:hypothetical protein [Cellulomonas pakistanensis]|uniref:DUF559 domain-containing protein n=1 Tax=Cellulomonas pakistanensis TaxID=992287 RepID=A0A919U663_9CELL|nr:hypothetical protein [Cellulomonas pakistanensis]GIG35712.1 hypothetical protein Cpa01nite_10930 [Cellulomonas pakistanensis]
MVDSLGTDVLLVRDVPTTAGRLRRRRDLERVRRGAYVERGESLGPARDRRRIALARIHAVHRQTSGERWFSHESAALLWGCDTVGLSGLTHLIQPSRPRSRGGDPVVRHHGDLPAEHRAEVSGLPVTTLARTVVDCAASLSPDRGIVIADSALRAGADRDALDTTLATRSGARGIVRAREVIELADGRAQSPGETLVRWALHSGGLPRPDLQVEVVTRRGRFFLDLGWTALGVAVEFDGFVKYSGAFGGTAPEVVFAEKQRQDALEDEGWRILRVTWDDLRAPDRLVARVSRALSRASR